MAWIDDRIWCHPKFAPLSPPAFAAYVKGLAYSSGMATHGRLDPSVQKLIGASTKVRTELVNGQLWDVNGDGLTVVIHDWDEHNGKRDERRAKDRERKRQARASAGQDADKHADRSRKPRRTAHVDGSDGSDGSDVNPPNKEPSLPSNESRHEPPEGLEGLKIGMILKEVDAA